MPATQKNQIALIVYAPALVRADERPLAIVQGMERVLADVHLNWTTSDEGQRIPVPDRDTRVAQERKNGGFLLLRNDDEFFRVSVTGWERPANISSGKKAQLEVHATLPLAVKGIAVAAEVLNALGEGAHAFWGHATPFSAGVDIARQTKNWAANPQPPPRGLPALMLSERIRSPAIPHRLGWLNYWSAEAVEAIGFPDPTRDAELLSRARRTDTGGWVVRLTDAPLDLDDPAHLDALKRAYERFPEVGGRASP